MPSCPPLSRAAVEPGLSDRLEPPHLARMNSKTEPTQKPDAGQPGITRPFTAVIAAVVVLTVLMVTIRSQEPIGAGIYYDDGAYLGVHVDAIAAGDVLLKQEIGDPILKIDIFHRAGRV